MEGYLAELALIYLKNDGLDQYDELPEAVESNPAFEAGQRVGLHAFWQRFV